MTSAIATAIDQVIRTVAPRLKSEGFRRHARTFVCDSGPARQIINFQASQWNVGGKGTFTLNLGVYFQTVAAIRGSCFTGEYPKEYDATIRSRIGKLMPEGLDHWWSITPVTDLDALAVDVESKYARYGREWLQRMSNLDEVAGQALDPLTSISVALALGRRTEAVDLVTTSLENANAYFRATLVRFAERHGLQPGGPPH